MNEQEFWPALEFRLCRELLGMRDESLHNYWCDGFIPESYLVKESVPRIVGQAWIGEGPKQEQWAFELYLPNHVESHEQIDWAALLPAEDVTRWLSFSKERRRIKMRPGTAVQDLE